MSMIQLRDDCTTAAEVVARGRATRARMRALFIAPIAVVIPEPPPVPIPTPNVRDFLFVSTRGRSVTLADICRAVASRYEVTNISLRSEYRTARLVRARHAFFYLARTLTSHSLSDIGRFVRKDHSTAHYGGETLAARRPVDAILDAELRDIEREITSSVRDPDQLTLPLMTVAGE